jgi:cell division septum initiation protein DivIVA
MADAEQLRQRVALLERELARANQTNADVARELRVLESKAKAYDDVYSQLLVARAERDALRSGVPSSTCASPVSPPVASAATAKGPVAPPAPSREDAELARLRRELELLDEPPPETAPKGHITGWQTRLAPGPRVDEVQQVLDMATDAAALEQREEAELAARLERLKTGKK